MAIANLGKPEFMDVGNPAKPFISAFALAAEISARRRQLEEQMMKMQLANQLGEAKLEEQAANYASLDAYRRGEVIAAQHRADVAGEKVDAMDQQKQRLALFTKRLYSIPDQKGTDGWEQKKNLVVDEFSDVAYTPDGRGIINPLESQHTTAAKGGIQAKLNVQKDFFNKTLKAGIPPLSFANDANMWGTNSDKSRYLDFELDPTTKQPVRMVPPNSRDNTKAKQGLYKAITLKKDEFEPLYQGFKQTYTPEGVPSVTAAVRADHADEWAKAKAAIEAGKNPIHVKNLYGSKGFIPTELDSDTPPQ